MNIQNLQPVMRHWRIIFFLWIVATIISTAFSINAFITSPLHPLYFVIVAIFPSTLFLCVSLLTAHSFFSQLFIAIQSLIFKKEASTPFNLPVRYIVQLISNATWITIFITTLLILLFKFSFQSFDFYLGNTFTESKDFTYTLIQILNFVPEKLHLISFDDSLIQESFTQNNLNDGARSLWAKWVMVMIIVYGLLPRVFILSYYSIRSLLYSKPSLTTSTSSVIDSAKEKPLVTRVPKTKIVGTGNFKVALDITNQIRLTSDVIKLNDMESFQQFEISCKKAPAHVIEIFVDGNLMPDRGSLRRLIRLLNLTETAIIHVLTHDSYQVSIWKQHLSSILMEGETAHYETT